MTTKLDRWHIRGTGPQVMIVDKDGVPVAEKVYIFDAEWIVEQRERAATRAPRTGGDDGE